MGVYIEDGTQRSTEITQRPTEQNVPLTRLSLCGALCFSVGLCDTLLSSKKHRNTKTRKVSHVHHHSPRNAQRSRDHR